MSTDNRTLGVYAAIGVVALGVGALIGQSLASKPKSLGHVKISYLPGRGLAETTRLLLAEAGADWEDIRLTQDQVKELKGTKLPYNQVPILECSRYPGLVVAQSQAIQRFVAKHYGLYGKDIIETTLIDGVLEAILDIRIDSRVNVYSQPEEKKPEGKKKMETELFPKHLALLENILRRSGTDYFVGDKISIADIQFFNTFWSFKTDYPNVLNAFPLLQALYQRVSERPRISEWLHKRPVTPW